MFSVIVQRGNRSPEIQAADINNLQDVLKRSRGALGLSSGTNGKVYNPETGEHDNVSLKVLHHKSGRELSFNHLDMIESGKESVPDVVHNFVTGDWPKERMAKEIATSPVDKSGDPSRSPDIPKLPVSEMLPATWSREQYKGDSNRYGGSE